MGLSTTKRGITLKSAVQAIGTVAASALVVGGIVGGAAIARQAGDQSPVPASQPVAQTTTTGPQQVESGTVLKAKPEPKPATVQATAPTATVQEQAVTTTTTATTQEQTVTSDPTPQAQPTSQPADTQTTQASEPSGPPTGPMITMPSASNQ